MRKCLLITGLCALLWLSARVSVAKTASGPKSGGTLVIVFKDGHRQTFNLADIEQVEFPAGPTASESAPVNPMAPPRGRYIGKWECGEGNGDTFYITLKESGEAFRSLGNEHGKWTYTNGDALITWDDGAQDAIRRVGSRFEKSAYSMGKKFTDEPDNVAPARNLTPRPI